MHKKNTKSYYKKNLMIVRAQSEEENLNFLSKFLENEVNTFETQDHNVAFKK